jgi:hypothetical protein
LLATDHLRTNHRAELFNAVLALVGEIFFFFVYFVVAFVLHIYICGMIVVEHSDRELNRNGNMLSKLLYGGEY